MKNIVDASFTESDLSPLNNLYGEMMMTEATYIREQDRCVNTRLPPNFTKAQCRSRTKLVRKGDVNYITEKGMGMLAMSVMSAPPHAPECSMLGVTFLDLARVPKGKDASSAFCKNLPGKWYEECMVRSTATRAEFIQNVL